jgi:hypothetical protein
MVSSALIVTQCRALDALRATIINSKNGPEKMKMGKNGNCSEFGKTVRKFGTRQDNRAMQLNDRPEADFVASHCRVCIQYISAKCYI